MRIQNYLNQIQSRIGEARANYVAERNIDEIVLADEDYGAEYVEASDEDRQAYWYNALANQDVPRYDYTDLPLYWEY